MGTPGESFIFRQCITLRNGKRLCKPPGQAFRIPIGGSKAKDASTSDPA